MEKLEYVVRVNAGQKVQPKIISIRGTSDMFDRYKMRQLYVQVIGKGKMIRTVFLNVDDVAKDLKTEPSYLGAYFGYELGASSKYDPKKSERERASISGEYDTQQLSLLMKKFVREIVQCPGCHLPETTLSLDKKALEEWKAFLARATPAPAPEFVAQLQRISAAAKFDAAKTATLALDARVSAATISKETLKASVPFLEPFLEADEEAQIAVLSRVEEFCAEKPDLRKKAVILMKELYDLQLVGEEAVLGWHGLLKPGNENAAAVRKETEQLVSWLKTADEEEEEEEEGEEETEEKKP